jgi:hypothetical protein
MGGNGGGRKEGCGGARRRESECVQRGKRAKGGDETYNGSRKPGGWCMDRRALFSHSAEMGEKGRGAIDHAPRAWLRALLRVTPVVWCRFRFVCLRTCGRRCGNQINQVHGSRGASGRSRSWNKPYMEHRAALECRGGQERAPLVGRLALPRVVCVCGEMSHFGRSVR